MSSIRATILERTSTQKTEIREALQRYREIQTILAHDPDALSMLHDLVTLCQRYVEAVIRMEYKAAEVKRRYGENDTQAWKLEIQPVDEARRNAHNALLSVLTAFNRAISQTHGWKPQGTIPIGGIYTGDPDDLSNPDKYRAKIADWAFHLVIGLGAE